MHKRIFLWAIILLFIEAGGETSDRFVPARRMASPRPFQSYFRRYPFGWHGPRGLYLFSPYQIPMQSRHPLPQGPEIPGIHFRLNNDEQFVNPPPPFRSVQEAIDSVYAP